MTDRHLLELAARAAGRSRAEWDYDWLVERGVDVSRDMLWNPLENNGDALWLSVKLHIPIDFLVDDEKGGDPFVQAYTYFDEALTECGSFTEINDGDLAAATRRAITRAAAAIGDTLPA